MIHATQRGLFMMWVGADKLSPDQFDIETLEAIDTLIAGCDPHLDLSERRENSFGASQILTNLPTCPRCAVLYDEAMTAREELLGRKAA